MPVKIQVGHENEYTCDTAVYACTVYLLCTLSSQLSSAQLKLLNVDNMTLLSAYLYK